MYLKKNPVIKVFTKAIVSVGLCIGIAHTGFSQGVQIDSTFGEDGFFIFPFQNETITYAGALTQKDNKLILAAFNFSNSQLLFIRTTENGMIDTEYGENGVVTINDNIDNRFRDMNSVAAYEDGSIIAALSCFGVPYSYKTDASLIKLNKFGF